MCVFQSWLNSHQGVPPAKPAAVPAPTKCSPKCSPKCPRLCLLQALPAVSPALGHKPPQHPEIPPDCREWGLWVLWLLPQLWALRTTEEQHWTRGQGQRTCPSLYFPALALFSTAWYWQSLCWWVSFPCGTLLYLKTQCSLWILISSFFVSYNSYDILIIVRLFAHHINLQSPGP